MIPGHQIKETVDAFLDGYDKDSLRQMLRFRLSKVLGNIVNDGAKLENVVFELVDIADRQGWDTDLVREGYRANPNNEALLRLYEKYGIAPKIDLTNSGEPLNDIDTKISSPGFQKIIRDDNPSLDINIWRTRLTEIESRVCRIDIDGKPQGTGFLVGPDVVLTNYHVIEDIIANKKNASSVSCLFDYKELSNYKLNPGIRTQLSTEIGILIYSPYSSAENASKPDKELPNEDQLDFALLRLDRALGNEPKQVPRGFELLPLTPVELKEGQGIIIAQHPAGTPMKLVIDTQGVIETNQNKTRIRYKTNTDNGSSGSPVYDMLFNLSALHHYGDPQWKNPIYNQGILPLHLIRKKIVAAGFGNLLG